MSEQVNFPSQNNPYYNSKIVKSGNVIGAMLGCVNAFNYTQKFANLSSLSQDEFVSLKQQNKLSSQYKNFSYEEFRGALKQKADKILPTTFFKYFSVFAGVVLVATAIDLIVKNQKNKNNQEKNN